MPNNIQTSMLNLSKKFTVFIALLLSIGFTLKAQDLTEGETLWKQNCTACHQIKEMKLG